MPARHYEPSERDRMTVRTMAVAGVPHSTIAACLDISPDRLRTTFRRDLDTATAYANARVSQTLLQAATNAVVKERRQEVGEDGVVRTVEVVTGFNREGLIAAIFWMKTRGGWKYANHQDAAPAAAAPTLDLTAMPPERKLLLLELLDEAVAGTGDAGDADEAAASWATGGRSGGGRSLVPSRGKRAARGNGAAAAKAVDIEWGDDDAAG